MFVLVLCLNIKNEIWTASMIPFYIAYMDCGKSIRPLTDYSCQFHSTGWWSCPETVVHAVIWKNGNWDWSVSQDTPTSPCYPQNALFVWFSFCIESNHQQLWCTVLYIHTSMLRNLKMHRQFYNTSAKGKQ